ncbi:hypothetical protein PLESTB_001449600 [Pleodorina starrii]|uniref:NAD(P)H dehydrogenase (quinone) n=1 Tax=Pleodorina starrii TaxID=330485 RepID=A0A9W6F7F1_9CHLO|nr:hypothetical protein PLESTB_001449600 [Pleodorina starrii]GLC68274.1 hypothetical protein PLESTF_000670600 [Pleodorina starrii]
MAAISRWSSSNCRQSCKAFAAARSRAPCVRVRAVASDATAPATAPQVAAPIRIVGISGSLRKASTNTGLLRAASRVLPAGCSFEIVDISGLPHYNEDMWQAGGGWGGGNDESVIPEAIRTFRSKVLQSDAVVFATPEYNVGITSVLKAGGDAAIDWGVCGHGPNVWDGKAALVMGSGGSGGTGDVVDPKVEAYVRNGVAALVTLARKLKA